jgi:hypothetical protein
MATNWSSSSGFGGGIGAGRYAQGGGGSSGTGSGLGASVGQGLGSGSSYTDVVNKLRGTIFGNSGSFVGQDMTNQQGSVSSAYSPPSAPKSYYVPPDNRQEVQGFRDRLADPLATADTMDWSTGRPIPTGSAGTGSYMDMLAAQYGPQLNAAAAEPARLQAMFDLQREGRGLDRSGLVSGAGFDRQELGLKSRGIGLDRDSNALKAQGYGLDRKDNESERDYIGRLRELSAGLNTNTANRISFEGQDKARDIKSEYLTGGTSFAPGQRYDIGTNYLRTINDLQNQEFGYQKEVAGFDRREQGLDVADQKIGLSESELGIANQRLDLMAGQLGIDRSRLEDSLQRGLAQLGLSDRISAAELSYALTQAAGDYAKVLSGLASDALALGVEPGDWLQAGMGGNLPTYSNPTQNSTTKVM